MTGARLSGTGARRLEMELTITKRLRHAKQVRPTVRGLTVERG